MRKVMYVVAVLALAWIACAPMGVSARPTQEVWTTYYSGPDFQTEVGLRVWPSCWGPAYGYGRPSPYQMVQIMWCDPHNPDPLPDPVCYVNYQVVPCPASY